MCSDVMVYPSYKYASNFSALEQLYSSTSARQFYHFSAVPDLIYTKSSMGAGGVYLNDKTNLFELKNGGRLPGTLTSNIQNVYAEIIGGLHFLVTASIIKAITNNKKITEV